MSLFKVCSWWTTQCADVQPNYDSYSLDCCRLGLNEKEKDYVVIGSHSGYLSIYKPSSNIEKASTEKEDEDFDIEGYKPTDLLLEIKLAHPIIGILCGRFLSTSSGRCQLAVLHPLKLSIYALQINEGIAEHGHHSKLDLCVEYKFAKFAFSFCKGSFGGVKGKEFLCIRHIENLLSFFEQDGIAYECKLPGERNVPSILVYAPRIDCFVTVSFECELECYRYQDLCQSSDSVKEIEAVWSCCIGEYALDVSVQQISTEESIIMVLGERNLIAFSDKGLPRFIKRLDYTPVCFHSFIIGWYWETNARLVTAIVSDRSSLLVYEESKLIWSAQLTDVPVAIRRSNIDNLTGAIVTLGPTGLINIGYLGSDPNLFKVPPLNLQEINYEKAQKELAELEKEIQSGIDITDFSVARTMAEHDLQLKMTVDGNLVNCSYPTKFVSFDSDTGPPKMCRVALSLKPSTSIEQIQVYFNVRAPLKCSKNLHVINCIETDTTQRLEVWIYIDTAVSIASFKINAIVSFINKQSICRILETSCSLPMEMFFKKFSPQKESSFKVTMNLENINANNGNILSILPATFRMDGNNAAISSQAIGLKDLSSDAIVTIVAAKNSNRIRIQSDHLTPISCITEMLIERLINLRRSRDSSSASTMRQHDQDYGNLSRNNDDEPVKVIIVPQIPTDEVLKYFEAHHKLREEYYKIKKDIESISAQIRLIQRRLLTKLEDKKSGAIDNIMMLFQLTHKKISEKLREANKVENILKKSQAELSSVIALTRIIVKHLNLPPSVVEGFCAILDHQVTDWLEQSWEEIMAPAMEMLTYIGPLRKHKHGALDDNPSFVIGALDLNRFKRHFTSLIDRVCRLAITGGVEKNSSENNTVNSENTGNDYALSIVSDIQEEPEHLDETESSDWINQNDPADFMHFNDLIASQTEES